MLHFKQFIERQDVPTMEALKNSAHQAYGNLVSHCEQYEKSFRKRRANEDHHEYVMELAEMLRYRHHRTATIGPYSIVIHRTSGGVLSKLGELGGEVRGSTIILYDKTISELIQELNSLADIFRWHHVYNQPKKAGFTKKQAKEIFPLLLKELENKKESFLRILYHELTHTTRHGHIPDRTIAPESTLGDLARVYANNPVETDAYFLERAHRLLQKKQYSFFPELLRDFKKVMPHWEYINEKNQKKMIARLYQLFTSSKI